MSKKILIISSLILICSIIAAGFLFRDSFVKKESGIFEKVSKEKNLLNPLAALNLNWLQSSTGTIWPSRSSHAGLVFNNKMWIMGGNTSGSSYYNDDWYSSDGITWTAAVTNAGWGDRNNFSAVVFNNKMWVMGGNNIGNYRNDVWYSSNGVSWTQATFNAGWQGRHGQAGLVFNNKMWVMGGFTNSGVYKNDVWYSSDGITWTQATANAEWSARMDHAAIIYNNKMWIMGGNGIDGFKNDVWYSSDGIHWIRSTANATWQARSSFSLVDYNDKMWIMGGNSGGGIYKNDVWYSSDGTAWTKVAANAGWNGRMGSVALTFNNKIWLMGGYSFACSTYYCNDVWSSTIVMPTLNFSAAQTTIAYNLPAVLSWTTTNADSCTASGGWSGSKAISGSNVSTDNLVSTVTFQLSCLGAGGAVSNSVTVNVLPPNYTFNSVTCLLAPDWPQKVVIDSISYPCNMTRPYCNNDKAQQGIGQCCANVSPYADCMAMITVPNIDLKINNSNGPISVPNNSSATLSWTTSGADFCTASGDWSGSKALSGSGESTGSLISSKTYTLTCTNPIGSASDSVAVSIECIENWSCDNWSTCANNQQTRSCTDSNNCGTTTNRPAIAQTCTSCTENWICNNWSTCSNNQQTRTCADANSCGTTANKPAITQTCSAGGGEVTGIPEGALIRAINDIDVYIVKYMGTKRFKRLILSPSVFNSYGHLKWSDIKDVSKSTVDSFTTSEVVRATEAGDVRVYKLYPQGDTGEKRWIKTDTAFTRMGLDWDSVYTINETDRDSYITGQVEE